MTERPFGPPGSTAGAGGAVAGSHVFANRGMFTVTVCVSDDDLATTCDTLIVTVDRPPSQGQCTIAQRGRTLVINGDDEANTIDIHDNGAGGVTVSSDCNVSGQFAGVRNVRVQAAGGNDRVTFRATDDVRTRRNVMIHLGNGDDFGSIDVRGVDIMADVSFKLAGGSDADNLAAAVDAVLADPDVSFLVQLFGGRNDDAINAAVVLVGRGDQAELQVFGDDGQDGLRLNVDASAATISNLDAMIDGGTGADIGTVPRPVRAVRS